jgi:hypothetical protein
MKRLTFLQPAILSALAVATSIEAALPAQAQELVVGGSGDAASVHAESKTRAHMTYESESPGEIDPEDPLK